MAKTKAKLKAALDAANIAYEPDATNPVLQALLDSAPIKPEDKTTDQLTEDALAEAAGQDPAPPESAPTPEPPAPPGVKGEPIVRVSGPGWGGAKELPLSQYKAIMAKRKKT